MVFAIVCACGLVDGDSVGGGEGKKERKESDFGGPDMSYRSGIWAVIPVYARSPPSTSRAPCDRRDPSPTADVIAGYWPMVGTRGSNIRTFSCAVCLRRSGTCLMEYFGLGGIGSGGWGCWNQPIGGQHGYTTKFQIGVVTTPHGGNDTSGK